MMLVWFYATVLYRIGSGPLWSSVVGRERDNCINNWWTNILFINNYVQVASPVSESSYVTAKLQKLDFPPSFISPLSIFFLCIRRCPFLLVSIKTGFLTSSGYRDNSFKNPHSCLLPWIKNVLFVSVHATHVVLGCGYAAGFSFPADLDSVEEISPPRSRSSYAAYHGRHCCPVCHHLRRQIISCDALYLRVSISCTKVSADACRVPRERVSNLILVASADRLFYQDSPNHLV